MSIGSRIKERRETLGLTQVQLAELLGVTKGAIGNYETDANSPKASMLYKVFEVLKCDANYLFQDEIRERREHTASPWEMEHLVKKYRSLDPHGKEAVESILEVEFRRVEQAKERAKMEVAEELLLAPSVVAGQEPDTPPSALESMTTEQLESLYEEQQYKKSASGSA